MGFFIYQADSAVLLDRQHLGDALGPRTVLNAPNPLGIIPLVRCT